MSWKAGGKAATMDGDEPAPKGKSAMPPACPRCELTKSQFTRTIQNYQKAYRKKVEGLKTELKSSRTANSKLSKQVKDLKRLTRVHVPSLAVGLAVGALAFKFLGRLLGKSKAAAAPTETSPEDAKADSHEETATQHAETVVPATSEAESATA